jgi:hypothetical protein
VIASNSGSWQAYSGDRSSNVPSMTHVLLTQVREFGGSFENF